jgi:uncharacterized protein
MLVVVDTNVMLSAFARQSPIARLFRALANGEIRMAVTAAIILEYEEIAGERGGVPFAANVMHWLSLVSAAWNSVDVVQPSFQFQVISSDPDDNKFVDCAIVANADFVITNDTDYAVLANAGYKPQPVRPEEFIARYLFA